MSFLSLFINKNIEDEEITYSLTTAGYSLVIVLFIILLLLGSATFSKKKKIDTKQLIFSAILIALGYVTSYIKLFHMPMGGSVTLLSMFFISLIGYLYGPYTGIFSATCYGFLQLMAGSYIISLPQLLCDYILAFAALGLSGLFFKKHSVKFLIASYLTGVLGRLVFAVLSGYIFFGMWAPDNFPNAFIYSLVYNGAYIGAEAAITVFLLCIPIVSKTILRIKNSTE